MDKYRYNLLLDEGLAAQAAGDTAKLEQIRGQIRAMEAGFVDAPADDNLSPGLRELVDDTGPGEAMMIGAGRTLTELGRGLKELVGGTVERDPAEEAAYAALQQESPWMTGIGAGLPYIPGAVAAGAAGVGAGLGALGHMGAQGAVAGLTGALQAGTPGERLERGAIDAALGGVGEGVFRGVQALIPRALPPRLAASSQGIEAEGTRYGVPVYAADLPEYQTGMGQRLANAAEGTSQFARAREAQRDALAGAAQNEVSMTGVAPGDAPDLVQAKAKAVLAGRKAEAGRLYDIVEAQAGDAFVPTPKLRSTVAGIRDSLDDAVIEDAPLAGVISRMDERLGGSSEFDRLMTFSELRALRSTVAGQLRDTQQGLGQSVGTQATRAWTRIEKALRTDMEDWAQGKPLYPAWKQADQYYRDMVVPFKIPQNRALINMINNETSGDASLDTLLRQTGGATGRLNVLTGMLDNDTSALRSRFVDMAIQKATNAEGTFSPVVFSSQLNRQPGVVEALYGKDALKGLELLMAHLGKGINSATSNPKTGARTLPLVSAGLGAAGGHALVGGPVGILGGMVAAPAMAMGAAKLLTTPRGLSMLRGLGRGTGTIEDVLARINTGAGTATAIGTQRAEYDAPGPVSTAIWQAASQAATIDAGNTSRELAALAKQARKDPIKAGRAARELLRDVRARALMTRPPQNGVATAASLHIKQLERLLNDN